MTGEGGPAIFEISSRCFVGNWSYTPIPWEEFHAIYAGVLSVLDPEMILFVIEPGGEPVGFVFGYPDYAEPVRRMGGHTRLSAKLRFLMARGKVDTAILKTLAIDSDYRDLRLGSLLAAALHDTIAPDNASVAAMADRCSAVFREYAIFETV